MTALRKVILPLGAFSSEETGWARGEKRSARGQYDQILQNLFKGPFIADLPPELMQCKLGCRVLECSHGKWRSCENRIRRMNEETAFLKMKSDQDSAANR
jgi:hypothetical protein